MAKKSYALRNRRGYMDSTFNDGLRAVLQWLELRRQQLLLKWQKELYMLRRMWIPRYYAPPNEGGLLPGGHTDFNQPVHEELNYMRLLLQGPYYAPGY